jgi:hypothetical protein
MPGGGSKPGERRGGRKRGSRNRRVVERERQERQRTELANFLARASATDIIGGVPVLHPLDVLRWAGNAYVALADHYRSNPEKFDYYMGRAQSVAKDLAPYCHPKFMAVAIAPAPEAPHRPRRLTLKIFNSDGALIGERSRGEDGSNTTEIDDDDQTSVA